MKKIVRIHASSGTTGKPTVGAYTKEDLDNWAEQVARVAVAAGARRTIFSRFPLATACLPARWACITAWKKSARR